MFHDCSGRLANSVEEAQCYIFHFIAENLVNPDTRVRDRSHGYDLYLPWLLEVIENIHVEDGPDVPNVIDLDELYMEASWALCNDGFLRPGPRRITGDNSKDGYGKGYALTRKGVERVQQEKVDPPEAVP